MKTVPFSKMRRQDRAIEDEAWIKDLLIRAPICSLAAVQAGLPYLHFNNFVFDPKQNCIYIHGAREGRFQTIVENSTAVCLGVWEMGHLLPAKTALGMSMEFSSIIIQGRIRAIQDAAEARQALQMLLDKYFSHLHSGKDYRPLNADEVAQTSVYRVEIDEWSGKQKAAEPNFPGAFTFSPPGTENLNK